MPAENTAFNMKYLKFELAVATEGISRFALFAAFLALVLMSLMLMRPAQS